VARASSGCLLHELRVPSLLQFSALLSEGWCGSGGCRIIFVQCCGIMPKDVLQNADNEVEFMGVFRPPKRSTKESVKLFLYNSEAGTVLGRTGSSWGKDVLWLL
jgi:hypothetical protein